MNIVVLTINANITPMERIDYIEKPIGDFLKDKGLGRVDGGGTQIGKEGIEFIEIFLLLKKVSQKILEEIANEAEKIGLPQGSTIEDENYFIEFGTKKMFTLSHANTSTKKKTVNNKVVLSDNAIEILLKWADSNNIPDVHKDKYGVYIGFPRDKTKIPIIQYLDISECEIKELPKELFDLTSLTNLNIGNNKISSIPQEIEKLIKLKTLDLTDNKFIEFPIEILNLKNLKELWIGGNSFKSIPLKINLLQKLEVLELTFHKCKILPSSIGDLSNLKSLDLGMSKLEILPKEIGNLLKLKSLTLEKTNIKELPKEIGKLKELEELFVPMNNLTTLPKEIGNLKKLDELSIEGNPIQYLPKECKWLVEDGIIYDVPKDVKYK